MKTPFIRLKLPGLDDPKPPEPAPFPIRIVSDLNTQLPLTLDDTSQTLDSASKKPKVYKQQNSDYFYDAYDRFLCRLPARTSCLAKKIDEQKQTVEQSPGDGLQRQENAFTSWEQAASECRAKVAAIVEECNRLNQKYRDTLFDVGRDGYCLRSLDGRDPKSTDCIDLPPEVKRVSDIFDKPEFFIDGAGADDVHQGNGGDCWFLAALMAISAKKKQLIEDRLCVARDEKVGVYAFVFFRDGEWVPEVIDDKLYLRVGDSDELDLVRDWDKDKKIGMPMRYEEDKMRLQLQRGGEALYFSHCKSDETWVPLIEKAYAKAHEHAVHAFLARHCSGAVRLKETGQVDSKHYLPAFNLEDHPSAYYAGMSKHYRCDYTAIEGGFTSEGIEDLTGGVACVLHPEDIMDKDRFWKEQLSQVNEKYLFGGGSKQDPAQGVVGSHAYAVLEAWEEGDVKLLKLRNPWGEGEWEGDWSDGSANWTAEMMTKLKHKFGNDGVFWISYSDFLKRFQSINRVRLFSEDWQVAQCWTSVNVPWAVDYLDTKFQFTIKEKCSVVIVLSQPDDRYWMQLRGRYTFSLHFKVYKEGNTTGKWIVRSMHNSGNENDFTRSVSAEIEDLEAGTYDVVFKVTAGRPFGGYTAESAILKYATDRKQKLLAVGRRFDYAQSKGNLRALEEANKKKDRQEKRDLSNAMLKKNRKISKLEREKARLRKKRVDDAMREKNRAVWEKRMEKAKQREERRTARDKETSADSQVIEEPEDEVEPKAKDNLEKSDLPAAADLEATTSNVKNGEGSSPKTDAEFEKVDFVEPLSRQFSSLAFSENRSGTNGPPIFADEGYESPVEAPEKLEDKDFDWDSDLDDIVNLSEDEDPPELRYASSKNQIFADDPWNAMCVLGLRVYSENAAAKVSVIKGKNSS